MQTIKKGLNYPAREMTLGTKNQRPFFEILCDVTPVLTLHS